MTNDTHITIEKRRYAALIEALKLARYALLRTGRRFDCPPHDHYTVAHTINLAIAENAVSGNEVHS
jgi:hypothetical protein